MRDPRRSLGIALAVSAAVLSSVGFLVHPMPVEGAAVALVASAPLPVLDLDGTHLRKRRYVAARSAIPSALLPPPSPLLLDGEPRVGAPPPRQRPPEPWSSPSRSWGWAARGRLLSGVLLEENAHLRFKRGSDDSRHGTVELVAMLERAAKRVASVLPGSRLTVGDLSRESGGRLPPHRSHRSGRDVDIGFYVETREGRPIELDHFLPFKGDGESWGHWYGKRYRFDDARNWALVASMLTDPHAEVQYIFVSRPLRARLLETGRKRGASVDLLRGAEKVLRQPSRGGRHHDHFHVRIYCPPDDRPLCEDRLSLRDPPMKSD